MIDLDDRARWLASSIIPHEERIRRSISAWRLPAELEVDDILQEAYAKLSSLASVAQISSPVAYFLQVSRSIFLMHVRRAKLVQIDVMADLEHMQIAADEPGPEASVSDSQQLRILADAVAALPEPNRTIFKLRMVDEMQLKSIGAALGMSENAVQKMLARSLKLLATALARGGKPRCRASMDSGLPAEGAND